MSKAKRRLALQVDGQCRPKRKVVMNPLAGYEELSQWLERQLAAFSGLMPQEHQSGISVLGKVRLSKIGKAHLRHHLYFPALVACRRLPEIAQWCATLLAKGKTKMQVVGAIMYKLLCICFGVLKAGKPFDPAVLAQTT